MHPRVRGTACGISTGSTLVGFGMVPWSRMNSFTRPHMLCIPWRHEIGWRRTHGRVYVRGDHGHPMIFHEPFLARMRKCARGSRHALNVGLYARERTAGYRFIRPLLWQRVSGIPFHSRPCAFVCKGRLGRRCRQSVVCRMQRFHGLLARSMPHVVSLRKCSLEGDALRKFCFRGMCLLRRSNVSPELIIQKKIHVNVAGISHGYIGTLVVGRLTHVGGGSGFKAMRFSLWGLPIASLSIRIHNAQSLHERRCDS